MKPHKNYLAAAVLVLGPILVVVAFIQQGSLKTKVVSTPPIWTSASSNLDISGRPATEPVRSIASVDKKSWHDTQQKLGTRLNARFKGDRLVEISGSLQDGQKVKGFDSKSKSSVTERAREVAELIAPYVGVPQAEWSNARIVTGPRSAQVYFEQSAGGLPLLPAGVVSMDFGPEGQLIQLATRLFPDVQILGEEKIPHTLAESIAREGVSEGMPSIGGRRVLWVPHPDAAGKQTIAYRAYEFFVGPRQVLVNATTGHVISSRDRGIR